LGLVFVALIFTQELFRDFPQMYLSLKDAPFVHGAESELSLLHSEPWQNHTNFGAFYEDKYTVRTQ